LSEAEAKFGLNWISR